MKPDMDAARAGASTSPTAVVLTIAIPTFNRKELLQACLTELIAQVDQADTSAAVRIIVIDNASPEPVSGTLENLPSWAEVRRNPFNVGGNANILRCFEACTTPWLWVIGDDDLPEPGAIRAALDSISKHHEAVAIIHAVRNKIVRQHQWDTHGLESFLTRLDSFGNALFLPSTLYNLATLRPRFDLGYHYAYSCAPHLVLLLTSLAEHGGRIVFLPNSNIAYERPTTENRGWIIPIACGLPVLLELPNLTAFARAQLARHLRGFPTLGSLVHQTLLRQRFGSGHIWAETKIYLNAVSRMPLRDAPIRRMAALLLLPFLLTPRLSYPLVAWLFRHLTGHASGSHKMPLERL